MTTERNYTRIDLLEYWAIQDPLEEWDVETSWVETQNTSRGMEEQTTGFDLVGNNSTLREMVDGDKVENNSTLKKVVNGYQRSEELSCHDTITGHLREGDS